MDGKQAEEEVEASEHDVLGESTPDTEEPKPKKRKGPVFKKPAQVVKQAPPKSIKHEASAEPNPASAATTASAPETPQAPAKTRGGPSTPAERAVNVANAEASGANLDPAKRRALWMQYLRSRKGDNSGDDSNPTKVPAELKSKVEAQPRYYFELWLKSGKNWAKVRINQIDSNTDSSSKDKQMQWVQGWKTRQDYPAPVAKKLIAGLKGKEGYWRKDDALSDEEFDHFRVPLSEIDASRTEDSSRRERILSGDLDGTTPDEVVKLACGVSSGSGANPADPTVDPEEEKKKAEEREKRLEEIKKKRAEPAARLKRWQTGLPEDRGAILKAIGQIESSKVVPAQIKAEYKNMFNEMLGQINKLRDGLDAMDAQNLNVDTLKEAEATVTEARKHLQAWKSTLMIFDPAAKAAAKAKAKAKAKA